MTLIIVESPTKARTFNRILKGKDYFVYATMGHFRDLPSDRIAIDYSKKFKPDYQIIKNKEKIVEQLKKLAEKNKEIILATDLDREGESISYHVAYILGKVNENWPDFSITDKSVKRIVFHEITPQALSHALENPSILRLNLVKAQQARRLLDRIVGYELSPLLWKKTGKNWLSAGRVQTVALRLVVEREKEINAFKIEQYYQIYAFFDLIKAKLISKNEIHYESREKIRLFVGEYTFTKTTIDKNNVEILKKDLIKDTYKIAAVEETMIKKYPPPPYTTSLLQQDAFYKLGYSSKMTMRLAQNLYEQGQITYHRTDSFNLSSSFVFKAKDYIEQKYGKPYALEKPRGYRTKSRMAQEAHEAIRPTKLKENIDSKKGLTINHRRLYELIFKRSVATQMKEADVKIFKAKIAGNQGYLFESESEQVIFDGFFRVLNPQYAKDKKTPPHQYKKGVGVTIKEIVEELLETKAPPRYNEASLIRTLEEKGIGRPSTYAPILTLIQEKNYVEKEGRYFIPTNLGSGVCDYLSFAFPNTFSLDFTAKMEEELDAVADNSLDFIVLLERFFGSFKKNLEIGQKDTSKIVIVEKVLGKCPKCGHNLISRFSKYGKFIACSNYPKCRYTKSILKTVKGRVCPKCGGEVVVRFSKSKKRFYGCSNYPKCDFSSWRLVTIPNNAVEKKN